MHVSGAEDEVRLRATAEPLRSSGKGLDELTSFLLEGVKQLTDERSVVARADKADR